MNSRAPDLETIRDHILVAYDMRLTDFLSDRRPQYIVEVRGVCVYLAKRMTKESYPTIAEAYGYGDHSSAMHVDRKTSVRMETDAQFFMKVREFEKEIRTLFNRDLMAMDDSFEFTDVETEEIMATIACTMQSTVARTVHREIAKAKANMADAAPIIIEHEWTVPDGAFATAVADVVAAMAVLDLARFTNGQAAARRKLDTALATLRREFFKTNRAIERIAS